jgi:hypothetical protein
MAFVPVFFLELQTGKLISNSNCVKVATQFITIPTVPGIEWATHSYLHAVLINVKIHDINMSQTFCNTELPQAADIPDLRVWQWIKNILHARKFTATAFGHRMLSTKTGRKKLWNEQRHDPYSSLHIRVIKYRETRWEGRAASFGQKGHACRVLLEKPEEKR